MSSVYTQAIRDLLTGCDSAEYNQHHSPFLRLPGEVRNKISAYAFKGAIAVNYTSKSKFAPSPAVSYRTGHVWGQPGIHKIYTALPQVSEQVRREAAPLVFSRHEFQINSGPSLHKFFADIGFHNANLIQRLHVRVEFDCKYGGPNDNNLDDRATSLYIGLVALHKCGSLKVIRILRASSALTVGHMKILRAKLQALFDKAGGNRVQVHFDGDAKV